MPVVIVHQARGCGPVMSVDVPASFRLCRVHSARLSLVGRNDFRSVLPNRAGRMLRSRQLAHLVPRIKAVIAATFSGDEMKLCMTQCDGENTICFTLIADYSITKEGLVHGVVTGVDIDVKRDPRAAAGGLCVMPPAAIAAELQKFVDSPFSFRTKTTSAGVMVSNLKFAAEGMDRPDLMIACMFCRS